MADTDRSARALGGMQLLAAVIVHWMHDDCGPYDVLRRAAPRPLSDMLESDPDSMLAPDVWNTVCSLDTATLRRLTASVVPLGTAICSPCTWGSRLQALGIPCQAGPQHVALEILAVFQDLTFENLLFLFVPERESPLA